MRPMSFSSRSLLTTAIGAVLALGTVQTAVAQSAMDRAEQRRARHAEKKEKEQAAQPAQAATYPNATRVSPEAKASAKLSSKLQKMLDAYEAQKGAEARAMADELIANPAANAYEKSFAAQLGGQIAYEAGDTNAAKAYFKQVIEFNGLDNNGHFGAMYTLAQLQLQDEQYTEAMATIDRFLAESKSTNAEHLVLKGNALYRMQKYPEAAAVLKQAIASTPNPRADWQALLMGAMAESGDSAGAAKVAAEVAAKSPGDKRAQLNLVTVYQQSGQNDQAIATLERLRAAGQLTEEQEYRLLYSLYANTENKEAESIKVINEGLAKGVLKADFNTQLALAQAYYFSDQVPQAIEAYKKAAPLAKDGETYLNLAKVLWQADRGAEAKAAAQQAKAKGLKNPAEADKVIANAGK